MTAPTLDEQLTEIKRELGMRQRVYPRFVESKRITQRDADTRIARLEAVRDTIQALRDAELAKQATLFGAPPATPPKPGQDFEDIPF